MDAKVGSYESRRPLTEREFEEAARQIFEEGSESEHYNSETDSENEEDHASPFEAESDTIEVEPDSGSVASDSFAIEKTSRDKHFIGKDQTFKWKKDFPASARTRSKNIISHLPGPIGDVKQATTSLASFHCFITIEMLQKITDTTNEYIDSIKGNFGRERDANNTNLVEIKAFVAVLLMSGMLKASHLNFMDMWNTDGTGNEFVLLCMSSQRFLFLMRCIRFDSLTTRQDRVQIDKMVHIREIYELFLEQCKKNYSPGEYLTIDEMLVPFRGRCGFKQYIPNKPAKYDLKMYALVDARTFYTYNLELYVGSQPNGPYCISNSPGDVVKRLVEPIRGSNRNITTDNWYTSIPLALDLLHNYSLTLVGTLKKNKREIPPQFLPSRHREVKSSLFGHNNKMLLTSYVPKKYKSVILLSTFHDLPVIDKSSGDDKKPEVITFYNVTKGGVDVVDQLSASYTCSRRTKRWPFAIFCALLNIAGINAFVTLNYFKDSKQKVKRRTFLKEVALKLAEDHINIRKTNPKMPKSLKRKLVNAIGENTETSPSKAKIQKQMRCHLCPRKDDKKSRKICSQCNKNVCDAHSVLLCNKCYDSD